MVDKFISRIACNSYIVYNDEHEGFLIDPGYNVNNCLINHIKKLGVKIIAVLLTHCHYDHISALEDVFEAFPEATLFISDDEFDSLDNPKINLSRLGVPWKDKLLDFIPDNYKLLNDYESVNIAGFNVQMIKTPFHTKGSAVYYVESENSLFSGDTLFYSSIGRTDLPTGSSKTIESSLKKLIKLPRSTRVYPGHDVATTLDRELNYNSYLRNLSL